MIDTIGKTAIVINGAVGQDFSGVNFSGETFQGIFADCAFISSDLRGAIFDEGTQFINCDFSSALFQGTSFAKYVTSAFSPSQIVTPSAQIDTSSVLNSFALVTTNSIVSELPKNSSLFWPLAATALGVAGIYGLYKANQYCLSLSPKGLHEYPEVDNQKNNFLNHDLNLDNPAEPPKEVRGRNRKRKQPLENHDDDQLNPREVKRRKLNVERPENWRELLGADGMDRPKRHAASVARERIKNQSMPFSTRT